MAIVQGACTSFKEELLQAIHDFTSDTFKIALYSSSASLGPNTTVYTAVGEISGTGYTSTGKALTISQAPVSAGVLPMFLFLMCHGNQARSRPEGH